MGIVTGGKLTIGAVVSLSLGMRFSLSTHVLSPGLRAIST